MAIITKIRLGANTVGQNQPLTMQELHVILFYKHATGCRDFKSAAPANGEVLNAAISSSIHVCFISNHYGTSKTDLQS